MEQCMKFEIFPLEKLSMDGSSLFLGMTQAETEKIIGTGKFIGGRSYYFDSELAVSYDSAGKVDFIEFLGGIDGRLKPIIYGVSAFDTDADKLYELLRQHNGDDIDTERGYSYSFLKLSVGIYRESLPEDVAEMIEEAASLGTPMSDGEIEYETKKAHHWATIGFGVRDYYRN